MASLRNPKDRGGKEDTPVRESKDSKEGRSREKRRDKGEKTEKQTKIDDMLTHIHKGGDDPTIADLIALISTLDIKLNQLASKEYIETTLEAKLQNMVTESFVNRELISLKEEMCTEMKSEIDKVYDQIRLVKSRIQAADTEITTLKNSSSDMKTQLDKVIEENDLLKRRTNELKDRIAGNNEAIKYNSCHNNDLEQYTRRNSVRIYGIKDTAKDETPQQSFEKVKAMLNDKLHITMESSQVDIAHRLGKFRMDGNRPIICKFISRIDKTRVVRARKALKGSTFVVREDLTFKNARLLEKLSEKEEVRNAWSDEGKLIALLNNGKKIRVDLWTDLSKSLVSETVRH